ncbi:farnesyl-diphosphate synthase [Nostoc linckia z18]|jgi:geranylgeranyl diphosphate synthase type II|uniref:Polyprenyl synthetase family protein n=2 Tax=Nostoc TaxID=1177 RepID=A0ABR8H4J7_NOSPU|nr:MULTISPECIES: farnesyl diphosphate synthase [Nostoc]MBL1197825.1 polyprenyl synthetase family protein [Nostoc sp. GBBB01]MDZ8016045.1 polyprenyl synthetase family protein [Nostoc sp. ZfuVER08]PHK27203.1 farnesyl-diphosphate synthase [Nostoc linckia z15]PHK36485.1 farnesyl-diphosphate synthase [Nostoc linckia z16]MBC1241825.1 polyprenyl synthetase family protein [Nostoc sp. 2RC]
MVATDNFQKTPPEEANFNLAAYLKERQKLCDTALDRAIPVLYPETIYESMRYSLLAGGKRVRPILCLASCEMMGGTIEMAMPTACAVEMIHTMSLIHDDLPSMDNDDYRRGKLTNHKVYGEDVAILAGDGLLALAFEYVALHTPENVPRERVLQVVVRLGRALGAAGLVGGQVVDLQCEGKSDISLETLNFIHEHKTAALLEACVVCGGIVAGASSQDVQRITRYAQNIGLAFQIVDDILDITATQEQLGKTAGKDEKAKKVTYPSLWGIEQSRLKAQELVKAACAELETFGERAKPLQAIAHFIISRNN